MPKQFSDADKNKWLKLYDNGKTETWIARERAKCDIRTVKKGIEEARRRQDARIARVELVKEALRKHQDSLLEELERMLKTLFPPPIESAPLSWFSDKDNNSIFAKPNADAGDEPRDKPLKGRASSDQGSSVRGLLREHLKNDRLWKVLARWEKAYASHLTEKTALQRKMVHLLEEKTGYKVVDKNTRPPLICSYTTGELFFRAAVRKAFGTQGADLESDIVADTASGTVRYRIGTILAEAPGREEECKKNLIDALNNLCDSPEVSRVVSTYKELEESGVTARQTIEQLLLLGLVTGQCQICRRLGM